MLSDKEKNQKKSKKSSKSSKNSQKSLEPLPITKILFLALLKENPKLSGYDLMQKVEEFSKGFIHMQSGSIYPTLHELENLDLVKSEQELNGRKRRVYFITENGKNELKQHGKSMRFRFTILLKPLLDLIEID